MVTGPFPPAHLTVDTRIDEAVAQIGAEQKVIEPQPCVARPAHPHIVPECVDALVGMEVTEGVGPATADELAEGSAAFRLYQCVVVP